MDNVKDMVAKVTTIAIIAMMIGFLSPVLFPDRTRIIYVNRYVVNNVYHINNSSLDVNTEDFLTRLNNNVSFSIVNNLSSIYDPLNTKLTNTTFVSDSSKYIYASFNTTNTCYLQNLSFACKNLAPGAAFLRFSIFNSKIVGNRYEPNIQTDIIAKTMFFPASMPDVATNTSYYLNKLLINRLTTNGIWFLKVNVTSGSVRNAYSTSVNNSFSYQYRTDTGNPYLRYHDVDFAFNLSFSPYNISLPNGIVKEGSLTNIICNFNQTLLFNLTADLSQTFDFGMYENYILHSFTYNLDFEEYGSYSYELIVEYSLILNQTYEILFNKFDFDIMDIYTINMYTGIMRIEYVIYINSIPTTYTENIVFNNFLIV